MESKTDDSPEMMNKYLRSSTRKYFKARYGYALLACSLQQTIRRIFLPLEAAMVVTFTTRGCNSEDPTVKQTTINYKSLGVKLV